MPAMEGDQGFTLVELLIALTIFAIGLLALGSMQLTAIQANAHANRLTREAAVAQAVMEKVRSWSPSDPRLLTSTASAQDWVFSSNNSTTYVDPTNASFTATYSVGAGVAGGAPLSGMSKIVIDVKGPVGTATLTEFRKTVGGP